MHGVVARRRRGRGRRAARTRRSRATCCAAAGVAGARRSTRAAAEVQAAAVAAYERLCPADLSRPRRARASPSCSTALAARPDDVPALAGHRQPRADRAAQARPRRHRPLLRPGQGGFGSDPRIARRAAARSRARAPAAGPRERTVVIGDTPRDIACARADGVRVVAVATGPFAIEALADADAVVDDARALLPVLEDFASGLPDHRARCRRRGGPARRRRGSRSRPRNSIPVAAPISPWRRAERVRRARRSSAWRLRRAMNAGSASVVAPLRWRRARRGDRLRQRLRRGRAARRRICSTVVMIVAPPGEPTARTGRPSRGRRSSARSSSAAACRPRRGSARSSSVVVEVGQLVVEQEARSRARRSPLPPVDSIVNV